MKGLLVPDPWTRRSSGPVPSASTGEPTGTPRRLTWTSAYSRGLSRFVTSGLAEKASQGHAIGRPPLGYRTEKSPSGRGAHHVTDTKTMPALQALLKGYVSGKHSFLSLSQELNSREHRRSDGKPFTESSISTVLNNRFYQGDAV